MTIKPIYHFDTVTETGVDKVPNDATIIIRDDGTGFPKQVQKLDGTGLTATSTISDFLADLTLHQEVVPIDQDVIKAETIGTTSITTAVWTGTQLEYDSLGEYHGSTLYFLRA